MRSQTAEGRTGAMKWVLLTSQTLAVHKWQEFAITFITVTSFGSKIERMKKQREHLKTSKVRYKSGPCLFFSWTAGMYCFNSVRISHHSCDRFTVILHLGVCCDEISSISQGKNLINFRCRVRIFQNAHFQLASGLNMTWLAAMFSGEFSPRNQCWLHSMVLLSKHHIC